jgi:hypothetical protein
MKLASLTAEALHITSLEGDYLLVLITSEKHASRDLQRMCSNFAHHQAIP